MRFAPPYAALLLYGALFTALRALDADLALGFVVGALILTVLTWHPRGSRRRKLTFVGLLWLLPITAVLLPNDDLPNYSSRIRAIWPDTTPPMQEELAMEVARKWDYPDNITSDLLQYFPPPPAEAISGFLPYVDDFGLAKDFGAKYAAVRSDWLLTNATITTVSLLLSGRHQFQHHSLAHRPELLAETDFNAMSPEELLLLHRYFDFSRLPQDRQDRLSARLRQLPPLADAVQRRQAMAKATPEDLLNTARLYILHAVFSGDRHFDATQQEVLEYVSPEFALDPALLVAAADNPTSAELDRIREHALPYYHYLLVWHPLLRDPDRILAECRRVGVEEMGSTLKYVASPEFAGLYVEAYGIDGLPDDLVDAAVAWNPDWFQSLPFGQQEWFLIACQDSSLLFHALLQGAELDPSIHLDLACSPVLMHDLIHMQAEANCRSPQTVAKDFTALIPFDLETLEYLASQGQLDAHEARQERLFRVFLGDRETAAILIDQLEPIYPSIVHMREALDEPVSSILAQYIEICKFNLAVGNSSPAVIPVFADFAAYHKPPMPPWQRSLWAVAAWLLIVGLFRRNTGSADCEESGPPD